MKLLLERTEDVNVLIESSETTGKKDYYIEGIFMQANQKNRNGRIYPLEILERECKRYVTNEIAKNKAIGELTHPDSPQVNPERASHKIISLVQEGDNFIGKAKVMDTPMGKIVKALMDEGVQLGVSTRGLGSVKSLKEAKVVQPDFFLSTVDIVTDPSAHDAWVTAIMESKEYIIENGVIKEQTLKTLQDDIKNVSSRQISEGKLIEMFESFLKTLK